MQVLVKSLLSTTSSSAWVMRYCDHKPKEQHHFQVGAVIYVYIIYICRDIEM